MVWRSIKQSCNTDSTMEAKYKAACEVIKEAVWLRKFLIDLEVVPDAIQPMKLYCDSSGAVQILRNLEVISVQNILNEDTT